MCRRRWYGGVPRARRNAQVTTGSFPIDKPPSAELHPEALDSDSLPRYSTGGLHRHDLGRDALVAAGHDPAVVDRVIRLGARTAGGLRATPATTGPKISERNFGRDRPPAITNRWREPSASPDVQGLDAALAVEHTVDVSRRRFRGQVDARRPHVQLHEAIGESIVSTSRSARSSPSAIPAPDHDAHASRRCSTTRCCTSQRSLGTAFPRQSCTGTTATQARTGWSPSATRLSTSSTRSSRTEIPAGVGNSTRTPVTASSSSASLFGQRRYTVAFATPARACLRSNKDRPSMPTAMTSSRTASMIAHGV